MTTFVLVPGACHGGWWYQPLVDRLHKRGHDAYALTLDGLGDGAPATNGPVTLDSHVDQTTTALLDAVASRDAADVVLVGHSYGGTVITAVADRVPEQIRALVYLDAFVPEDGDSCFAMTNDEQRRWYIESAGRTGLAVDPLPFFDDRARPHPLATLIQRAKLTGAWRSVPVKHYVAADWPDGSPFAAITEKVSADPAWTVHHWHTRHNVMHDGPERVLELIVDL